MTTSELVRDLQRRLSSLLNDPAVAKARRDRADRSMGHIADALIFHNFTVSEELLHLDASSVNGMVTDKKIENFEKHIRAYLEKNGTGNAGYDSYIAVVSEYLALVSQEPLHPVEVRHLENHPPKDTDRRKYCAWKARHLKDRDSLCRFCNCLQWPESV